MGPSRPRLKRQNLACYLGLYQEPEEASVPPQHSLYPVTFAHMNAHVYTDHRSHRSSHPNASAGTSGKSKLLHNPRRRALHSVAFATLRSPKGKCHLGPRPSFRASPLTGTGETASEIAAPALAVMRVPLTLSATTQRFLCGDCVSALPLSCCQLGGAMDAGLRWAGSLVPARRQAAERQRRRRRTVTSLLPHHYLCCRSSLLLFLSLLLLLQHHHPLGTHSWAR